MSENGYINDTAESLIGYLSTDNFIDWFVTCIFNKDWDEIAFSLGDEEAKEIFEEVQYVIDSLKKLKRKRKK